MHLPKTSFVYLLPILLLCRPLFTQAQQSEAVASTFWNSPNPWVDSVFNSLSEEEKIAQLFMVSVWPYKDSAHYKEVECLVKEQKVGGLIFFKGGPVKNALLTNYYQSLARVPMLIGIDGEWGLSMRIDSTPVFPRQMQLGAADEEMLVYRMGKEIGKHCRRLGIHMNFAPDVDVNNNPRNPVINDRSFGEDKYKVARMGIAYTKGMQSEKVMACAKHFPGHGDTDSDSHYSLPNISKSKAELDTLELYPFRELIREGVMSVMIAHLSIPSLDSAGNTASSLSKNVVSKLLKEEMGFKGLVLTDALNMQGVSKYDRPYNINFKSLQAGNDILLLPEEVPYSITYIKEAMDSGLLDREDIYGRIKKVLLCKYWAGLNNYQPVQLEGLLADLNCCSTDLLIREVLRKSLCIARNEDGLIPIRRPDKQRIALLAVGSAESRSFEKMALNYARMDLFCIDKSSSQQEFDSLLSRMKNYDLVIASLHNTSRFVSRNFGLTAPQISFINKLNLQNKMILVNNGNPYSMQRFPGIRSLIISYEDLPWNNEYAAQALFGAIKAKGKLPVTVYEYQLNAQDSGALTGRFSYPLPEEAGYDSKGFSLLDTVISRAIIAGATPGCQLLVAKEGKVMYHKAFGHHTYTKQEPVKEDDLYDLASLSKILATTMVVMKLHEAHDLSLDKKISHYLPELKHSNKAHITVRQLLMHQSGLPPFIPFYKKTLLANNQLNPLLYREQADSVYNVPVAANLFLHQDYEEMIWDEIIGCSLAKEPPTYVYSDLNYYFLKRIVERVSEKSLPELADSLIYKPLGLSTIGYRPLQRFPASRIVPTENDTLFRKQLLRGYVHDPGAALTGGVGGHAGLFANANDVAVIMQMLLNKGEYGGVRILKASTVNEFTQRTEKSSNRRGLGFDKPETDPKKASPVSRKVSPLTFGHTGFTGTCAWADPANNTVFVFLSNRVHPNAENKKLLDMNVRTDLQDLIYEIFR